LTILYNRLKKVKLSLEEAVETNKVVSRQGFYHFVDNRLTDGVEGVSLSRRLAALYSVKNS
jgi:hypothetical protein